MCLCFDSKPRMWGFISPRMWQIIQKVIRQQSTYKQVAGCLRFCPIITHLITCSIIHQYSHLEPPLPHQQHTYTPTGKDGSLWQAQSKWAPHLSACVYICVCVFVWQVLTVQESGLVQGQHLWASSVCTSVCMCVGTNNIPPVPPAMSAPSRCSESQTQTYKHTQRNTHLGTSTMQSYQSQPRLAVVLWVW